MLKLKRTISSILLLICCFFAIRYWVLVDVNPNWALKKFNQKEWSENENKSFDNSRAFMAEDLKKLLVKNQLTKDQVFSLLGEPYSKDSTNVIKYYLGEPCVGTSICKLEIEFDSNNVVKNVIYH